MCKPRGWKRGARSHEGGGGARERRNGRIYGSTTRTRKTHSGAGIMENGCKCHRAAHKNTNHLCCMPQNTCARAHTHTVVVAAPANAHTPHTHGRSRRRARKRTHAARARPKSSSCPHCQTVVHTTTPHPHRILLSTKSTPRRSWAAAARAALMGVGTAAPRRRHCCCLAVRALWRLYHGRKRVDSVMYNTTIISLETLNNLLAPTSKR